MKALTLQRVMSRTLAGIDLECDAGSYVVVGTVADGTEDLVRILAGADRPRRGSARVTGVDPFRSPRTRRRIGSLFATDGLPSARTVTESLTWALGARADTRRPEDLLEQFGLGAWAVRPWASLDEAEQRTLALVLALTVPAPLLLALVDPFSCGPADLRATVMQAIASATQSGAVAVCTTSSAGDAAELAAPVLFLERGRWTKPPPIEVRATARVSLARAVVRTERPRELAAALAREPEVAAVSFDASSPRGEVFVAGENAEIVALAISRVARRDLLAIHGIETTPIRSMS